MRGFPHGLHSFFLPVGAGRSGVAVRHAPLGVAQRPRRRQVDTSPHFGPHPDWAYRGGGGWGNLRANGHPNGGSWRQWRCVAWRRSLLETLDTLSQGQRAAGELIVGVIACLDAGLGIRSTGRGGEVAPKPVLQWLGEAADQLQACSPPVLHALRVRRVQRDELCALLRAVQDGLVSTAFSARSDRIQSRERERGVMQTQRKRASMPAFATGSPRRTREVRGRRADQANRVIGPVCALDTHLCAADVPGAAPRRRGAHPLNHAAARRGRPRHDQRDIWARNL